jgi:hypothetical protein
LGTGFISSGQASSGGNGQGVAWSDFDGDGDLDLYAVKDSSPNLLFRNNGNSTFIDVASFAGVNNSGAGNGAAWGDYDADGDSDLYVSKGSPDANLLYRNNGNSTFAEVGNSAGVADTGSGIGAAWGDYDGDGDLDLYLANSGSANRLYRNNGNGTFTEAGSTTGVNNSGNGLGVTWADFDDDGDLDIYLANAGSANLLYRNNGNGTFIDVGPSAGVADTANSQGVSAGDYDADGDIDIYVTNFGAANRLYRNNGNSTFADVGSLAGVNDGGNGIGAAWSDYDADGDLDLYLANWGSDNRLYRNNGNGTFADVAVAMGVNDTGNGTSVAWGDYDADGDQDLYLANNSSTSVLFTNNLGPYANTYLAVKVANGLGRATQSGVKVVLKTTVGGTPVATGLVDGGTGYGSQSVRPVHFYGLSPGVSYDVTIFWTDRSNSTHTLGTPDGSVKSICKGVGAC